MALTRSVLVSTPELGLKAVEEVGTVMFHFHMQLTTHRNLSLLHQGM